MLNRVFGESGFGSPMKLSRRTFGDSGNRGLMVTVVSAFSVIISHPFNKFLGDNFRKNRPILLFYHTIDILSIEKCLKLGGGGDLVGFVAG